MGDFGQKPPKKEKSGGFWGFVGDVLKNASVAFNPSSRRQTNNRVDPSARMEPVHAEREEAFQETIYRKTDGAAGIAPAVRLERGRKTISRSLDQRISASGRASVPHDGGSPLAKDVRARMEPQLGGDLSNVRVHTSGESATAAEGLGAKAFTVGNDVHFGSGNYQPGTKEGDRLLAHELTHVVQGAQSGVQRKAADGAEHGAESGDHDDAHVSEPHDPAEKEADAKADEVTESLHSDGKQGAGQKPGQKPAPISAKFAGVGRKIFRKPLVGADGRTPLGQSQSRPSGARAPEGPNLQPVIGKLTQAITMFTRWAQRPADPENTIAQRILRELEGCREQAQAIQESQTGGTPENQLVPRRQALGVKLQAIRSLDPQYALISISEMSVTVLNAKRQMAALSLPPWTMLNPAWRGEYERQLREQQDGMNAMIADQWKVNRDRYVAMGRSAQGTAMQRTFQRRMGRPPNTAAPHNPDQGPGGFPDPTGAPAQSQVNSHVGSQWPTRLPLIDSAVNAIDPAARLVTQMNVHMTVA